MLKKSRRLARLDSYLLWGLSGLLVIWGGDFLVTGLLKGAQGVISDAIGTACLLAGAWMARHRCRSDAAKTRHELLTALRNLPPGAQLLNRDERLIFTVRANGFWPVQSVIVVQADEDDLLGDGDGRSDDIVVRSYAALPWSEGVHHGLSGFSVTEGEDGEQSLTELGKKVNPVRREWRRWRMERKGLAYAGSAEVRHLIKLLRESEPVQRSAD